MTSSTILIVEDDAIIARHLQNILIKAGYQVQAVVDHGAEALRIVDQQVPSLVLMDIQLAGEVDNIEIAAQIQKRAHIPIVFLTALTSDLFLQRAKTVNLYGFITKPFEDRHLQVTVELALQKHRFEMELRSSQERYLAVVSQANDGIILVDADQSSVLEMNRAFRDLIGLAESFVVGQKLQDVLYLPKEVLAGLFEQLNQGRPFRVMDTALTKQDGTLIYVDISITRIESAQQHLICAIVRDVTIRHQAEEQQRRMQQELEEVNAHLRQEILERRRVEENFRNIFLNSPFGIFQSTLEGAYTIVNPTQARIFGYDTPEDMVAQVKNIANDLYVDGSRRQLILDQMLQKEGFYEFENEYRRKDGSTFIGAAFIHMVRNEQSQPTFVEGFVQDITESRRAEEAIRASEERYRYIYNQTPVMLHSIDQSNCLVSVSDYWLEALGYTREEVIGRPFTDFMPPETRQYVQDLVMPAFRATGVCKDVPHKFIKKNGAVIDVLLSAVSERDARGNILRTLSVFVDVTERNRAEKQLQKQVQRMASLRAVEMSITAHMDLRATLDTLVEQVMAQLSVDAACVLLFNPRTQALEDAADRGFRTRGVKATHLHLGEGLAGQAALERRLVQANNLSSRADAQQHVPYLASEGFASYFGVPLIGMGIVKGVLEVYHRTLLNPPPEWVEFLEALAGQAAIAIDNVSLFEDQQRANQKLTEAFDATIEGWASALALRDQDTELHTQRVTELTLELARYLGEPPDHLDHLRRGAILHDIGKMAVGDEILKKAGPLTQDEWTKMRQHPQFAFNWLASIEFLRPALDIPYCHHERWNGSGYPRGLKGNQIPLAARIFAVVDVYDSISSDRVYRPRMHPAEVRHHLLNEAGVSFDPEIVKAFLRMLAERERE